MSDNQSKRPASELLNIQLNADENQSKETSSKELITRKAIPGSPFHVVGNDEMGYYIAYGRFRLTEKRESEREALLLLVNENWTITTNLIVCIYEALTSHFAAENTQKNKEINPE